MNGREPDASERELLHLRSQNVELDGLRDRVSALVDERDALRRAVKNEGSSLVHARIVTRRRSTGRASL